VASSLQETVLVLYYHMIYVKNTNTFKRAGAGGLSSRDGTSLLFFFFFIHTNSTIQLEGAGVLSSRDSTSIYI